MNPEVAVRVHRVARRFGGRWALRGVSLSVRSGEVVALVGHNGSGKTTLLRVLATAIRPTLGGGSVFGRDLIRDADQVRELTGLLGHAPGLYHDLTAAENLRFSLRMFGEPADAGVIAGALGDVGLAADADTRVRGFSAGMQRRLALARLIVRPPRLVLLDEPFASLDADGIERMNGFIARQRSAGATTIVATHDPQRAAHLIDRLVRLDRGRIAGTTADAEPQDGDSLTEVDAEREWSA